MTIQHARFLERLKGSTPGVMAIAEHLVRKGVSVEIPGARYAPTAAEHEGYLDNGDLFAIQRWRYEVKTLNYPFTCAEDWPFEEIFVARKDSVDKALEGGAAAWISVNPALTHMVWIGAHTRDRWYTTDKLAKNTGNVETYYACPIECGVFKKIGGAA